MKKILISLTITLILNFCFAVSMYSECIPLMYHISDTDATTKKGTRAPAIPLQIRVSNHIIDFDYPFVGYEALLLQDGQIVYSQNIINQEIEIPTFISGTFEIRFVNSIGYYYGYIDLQ